MKSDCEYCENDRYIIEGCCSGHECGCMGQPTSITNCAHCNPEGDMEPSKAISETGYFKYLELYKSTPKPPIFNKEFMERHKKSYDKALDKEVEKLNKKLNDEGDKNV